MPMGRLAISSSPYRPSKAIPPMKGQSTANIGIMTGMKPSMAIAVMTTHYIAV